MNIKQYLDKHGLSQEQFASRLNVSQGLVSQWVLGKTAISPAKAKLIESVTGGEITRMECLYPEEPKRPKADTRPRA